MIKYQNILSDIINNKYDWSQLKSELSKYNYDYESLEKDIEKGWESIITN